MSQDRMVFNFISQKDPFMDTHKWRMTGPIYLASAVVFDGSIKIEEESILLADTTYLPALLLPSSTTSSTSFSTSTIFENSVEQRTYAYQNSTDEFYQSPVYTPSPLYSPQKRELDSPYRSTGHSVYDISSTDGSYGSALRPFGDNNRKRFSTIPEIPDRKNIIVPRRQSVLMATVVRSAAPMKVYWDATATASSLDIWLDDNTKECQDAFNASLVSVCEREREIFMIYFCCMYFH